MANLNDTITITESQIEAFRNNGHVLTRHLLSADEVAGYRDVINAAAYRYNTETRPLAERDTYGRAFLQIMNLHQLGA